MSDLVNYADWTPRIPTRKFYRAELLLPDNGIRDFIVDHGSPEQERVALANDSSIPANCIGYVNVLCQSTSTRAMCIDALQQLSRFVKFNVDVHKLEV